MRQPVLTPQAASIYHLNWNGTPGDGTHSRFLGHGMDAVQIGIGGGEAPSGKGGTGGAHDRGLGRAGSAPVGPDWPTASTASERPAARGAWEIEAKTEPNPCNCRPPPRASIKNTADAINRETALLIRRNVHYFAQHPDKIDDRLQQLDREWDIERTLEANAASIGLVGVVLGGAVNRRFLLLPALVTGFLLQHALQGWCPPVPLFRRYGFRTSAKIDAERYALKALRSDFEAPGARTSDPSQRAERAIEAVHV